ncbi:hypothetical protein [Microvirga antarctica]|uniref:hypothetical protein n=1 Tax=Microvirga antarctica TaxID=2819233 RepID=UPI001B3177AC|nr:hypothetical protein [Microvirga antarctica]
MSYRLLPLTLVSILGVVALTSGSALADKAGAAACAAKLPKDARAIYDASAPGAASASDLKQLLTQQTRSLAMAGTISRGSARASAEAAGPCVAMLKS